MSKEGEAKIIPFEEWFMAHADYFKDYQFPARELSMLLYQKLAQEYFDAGAYFTIDTGSDPTLFYTPKDGAELAPGGNVFITDHCWSVEPDEIHNEWKELDSLRERLSNYLEYSTSSPTYTFEETLSRCDGKVLELESFELESISSLEIPKKFPNLEQLSLLDNKITNVQEVLNIVALLPNLKAIWVNDNPIEEIPDLKEQLLKVQPKLEIINSKFTENWGEWALLYYSHNKDPKAVAKLNIANRNVQSLKKDAFANFVNLRCLDIRGNPADLSDVKTAIPSLTSIACDEDKAGQVPASVIFVNGYDREEGVRALAIPERVWDHLQPVGDRWALGDEVALSIHHSLSPNFAAMPAASPVDGRTYFCFWPVAPVAAMSEVTADLYPLLPLGGDPGVFPRPPQPMKPLSSKFVSSVPRKRPLKVFTDIPVFAENLRSTKFELVDDAEDADLQWIGFRAVEDFKEFYDRKVYVNQIEGEQCLTSKDFLYETVTDFMGAVRFLPETFILTEPDHIERFVRRYRELRDGGESTAFVVKAFDKSRAALMIATDSLGEVLRHASIGPRLAQRYLWDNATLFGLKFDLRFIVLLKSVKPMELFAYDVFWPRFAPKRWALDGFDDYERHFTVMNYRAPEKVTHRTWRDFVEQWPKEQVIPWAEMQQRIDTAIRDMFMAGCQRMVASPYTKAMYGIDVMISSDYTPIILECNFQPDCKRACNLCPTFVDDVFEVLFTDQPVTNEHVRQLPLPK